MSSLIPLNIMAFDSMCLELHVGLCTNSISIFIRQLLSSCFHELVLCKPVL